MKARQLPKFRGCEKSLNSFGSNDLKCRYKFSHSLPNCYRHRILKSDWSKLDQVAYCDIMHHTFTAFLPDHWNIVKGSCYRILTINIWDRIASWCHTILQSPDGLPVVHINYVVVRFYPWFLFPFGFYMNVIDTYLNKHVLSFKHPSQIKAAMNIHQMK